jgi:hypothetical protein
MCNAMLPVTVQGKVRWYEPCTQGDQHRHKVLTVRKTKEAKHEE